MTSARALPRLYVIADADALLPRTVAEGVEEMAEAGVRWIQVRAKRRSGAEWHATLEAVLRRLEGSDVDLWVDDRADLAALFPVAGVHLGVRDLPPAAVRKIVGPAVQIGLSTHDESQLAAADADPEVGVVAVGPIFSTSSKENPDPVIGLPFVRRARARTSKPLVAIGGLDAGNLAEVLDAGADAAVVLGAACRGDVRTSCRSLLAAAA